MKTLKRFALFSFSLVFLMASISSAHAIESIEVTGRYASAVGSQGQNFSPSLGINTALYLDRLLDPAVANFISVGYIGFTLRTDDTTKFHVFPILAGLELQGKVFNDLNTTFAFGVGGAFGYIGATGAGTNISTSGYLAAQLKAGVQYLASESIAIVARIPVNFLVGNSSMTYLSYDLGVQFKL